MKTYSLAVISLGLLSSVVLAQANSSDTNSSMNSNTSVSANANLNTNDPLATSLQSADFNSRSQIVDQVQQRIDAQKSQLKSVKHEGKHLDGQARSDFKSAWNDVEAREKDLKRSLRDARSATSDNWDAQRTKLATDYQAFEAAFARAQAQASGNTLNSNNWNNSNSSSSNYNSSATNSSSSNSSPVNNMNSTATDSSGATTGGQNSQATSSTTTSRDQQ